MLTHTPRPQTPSALDLMGLLELMSKPDDVRKMILEARDAEKSARAAIAELIAAQKKVEQGQAANTAKEAELAATERRLAETQANGEAKIAETKAGLAADRRKIDQDREDLNERISRQQMIERALADRVAQLDNRETLLAANERALEARRASFEEVAAMLQAKGLTGTR